MYDLRWAATNPAVTGRLDRPLIRRLAVLKIWVDANGLHAGNTFWRPGHQGPPFDPDNWLRDRWAHEFDIEDIGTLAVPVPSSSELSEAIRTHYRFLANLNPMRLRLGPPRVPACSQLSLPLVLRWPPCRDRRSVRPTAAARCAEVSAVLADWCGQYVGFGFAREMRFRARDRSMFGCVNPLGRPCHSG
jgi:hypothetical protein